jgi:hypothetical protein
MGDLIGMSVLSGSIHRASFPLCRPGLSSGTDGLSLLRDFLQRKIGGSFWKRYGAQCTAKVLDEGDEL